MSEPPDLAFIKPALAMATDEPPRSGPWLHEIKYDGYRMQAHLRGSHVTLFTRTGLDWTGKFGLVVSDLRDLAAKSAVIDCEAVVLRDTGAADFSALQAELKRGSRARITLMALDLLNLNGNDLRKRPLLERKFLLRALLGERSKHSLLQFSQYMEGDGADVFAAACRLGLEGIVSKRADTAYRSGRSRDWLKAKCVHADPFVVLGFTQLRGRPGAIGALALGYYAGKTLTYAGRVGTGFSDILATEIWTLAQTLLARSPPPMANSLTAEQRSGLTWIKPKLVAQVEYRGWSTDGLLRHSAFKAFREDKRPTSIRRPQHMQAGSS